MRTFLFTVAVSLLLTSTLFAQDEWRTARDEAKKHLRNPDPDDRLDAVKMIEAFDKKESVKMLLDFWALSTKLTRQYAAEILNKTEKRDGMPIKKKLEKGGPITLSGDEVKQKQEYDQLGTDIKELSRKIGKEDRIKLRIRKALSGMSSGEAAKVLQGELKSNKDWTIRAAAAEALGEIASDKARTDLQKVLKKEKDPRAQMSMIEALGRMRDKSSVEVIGEVMVKSEDWQVQVVAAQALRNIGDMAAVEHLINALEKVDGRVRDDINKVLIVMTGVDKKGDYLTWKDWWETNKSSLLGGAYKRPENKSKGKAAATTFYGIPVVSKRLVFILDRSGSMAAPAEWKPDNSTPTGAKGGGRKPEKIGDRKIDVAKYELKWAILGLPEDARFNVIFYNHQFSSWLADGLLPATKANKNKALKFFQDLEPSGATNIFDPTEKAFKIQDLKDPRLKKKDPGMAAFKGGVDTIYLMSDGMPNNGRITQPDAIRAEVKRMNADRKITIHTIAVGKSANPDFMKALAQENGGKFVHRK